jgi:hypothetical protein
MVLEKSIGYASRLTELPPFPAYRDESRRVLKAVPRPSALRRNIPVNLARVTTSTGLRQSSYRVVLISIEKI